MKTAINLFKNDPAFVFPFPENRPFHHFLLVAVIERITSAQIQELLMILLCINEKVLVIRRRIGFEFLRKKIKVNRLPSGKSAINSLLCWLLMDQNPAVMEGTLPPKTVIRIDVSAGGFDLLLAE